MSLLFCGSALAAAPEEPETGKAEPVTNTTAVLHGIVNPKSTATDSWFFEYNKGAACTGGFATPAHPAKEVKAHPAEAPLTHLQPGTAYTFCLVARNEAEEVTTGKPATFTTTAVAPIVTETTASQVGATEATVRAQINPEGVPTTYKLEYGTSEPYTAGTEASLPAAETAVGVLAHLPGLTPSTEYHVRFAVTGALGTTIGSTVAFKTAASGGPSAIILPDHRQPELVSPLAGDQEFFVPVGQVENQRGEESDVFTRHGVFRSSADGAAVAFVGEPTATGQGTGISSQGLGDQWLAQRISGQWIASDIQPLSTDEGTEYEAFTTNLSSAFFHVTTNIDHFPASPAPPENCQALESRTSDGTYHALFTHTQTPGFCGEGNSEEHEPLFAGASADGARQFFQTGASLTSGSTSGSGEGSDNLYQAVAGEVNSISVLPNGEPDPHATFGGPSGTEPGRPDFSHAVSADGARAFWTDVNTGIVYMRENGVRTVQISAGQAQYWTASRDGQFVFYTESEKLFRFNGATESREELAGEGPSSEKGVVGVVGAGEVGDYVYFVADSVLATNENNKGEKAKPQTCKRLRSFAEEGEQQERERLEEEGKTPEEIQKGLSELEAIRNRELDEEDHGRLFPGQGCNLYVFHAGQTKFIATLAPEDNEFPTNNFAENRKVGDWQAAVGDRAAEVTPDGHHLMLETRQRLTGYDNGDHPRITSALEIFVYDAESGQVACASCNPTGAPPLLFEGGHGTGNSVPPSFSNTYARRGINEEGTRVFFDTSQQLLPQDTNGTQDVYEWERDGTGTCLQPGGCIYLLSAATSSDNSFLIDASATGGDVFIATRAELLPGTGEQKMQIYDAHECTDTAPCPHEVSLACTGTGCQGVPPASPSFATPSSATFNGIGDFPLPAPPGPKKPLSSKQKLAKALQACHKKHKKHTRQACEKAAHKKYAGKTAAKKAKRATRASNNRRATQ